jgi:hypothetical protein
MPPQVGSGGTRPHLFRQSDAEDGQQRQQVLGTVRSIDKAKQGNGNDFQYVVNQA